MTQDKTLFVYFDGEQVAEPTLMGKLVWGFICTPKGWTLSSAYGMTPAEWRDAQKKGN